MKKWVLLSIIALICLVAILLAFGSINILQRNESAPPSMGYIVSCSPVAEEEKAYLKVRIEGEAADLKILLSDPDGTTADEIYVSKEKLLDGVETVKLSMAGYAMTPKAGTYTLLIVKFREGKLVYKKELTFSGANIRIDDVKIKTEYNPYTGYRVEEVNLRVSNSGDIPAVINKAVVMVDHVERISFIPRAIPPKESRMMEILGQAYIIGLERGVHHVTIKLSSGEIELAGYETNIELG
ncbi:MAG: hypothetical protein C0200_05190 [Thermoproteota archaeon]|nr:MAG: hypothetical protein C0200_05190 [Candidatus Korarchaeota archaeon]